MLKVSLRSATVRLRLTALYGGLFIGSGIVLLAITYVLAWHFTNGIQITTTTPGAAALGGTVSGQPAGQAPGASPAVVTQLHNSFLHQLLLGSGIALGVMAVVSIGLGWVVAGRVLGPVRTMTAATRRISQENLHERLNLPGPRDELKDLGETIDGLLARLEAAFDAQRRFVANVSHELRTPLAMMRTSLDVAEGKPHGVPADVKVLSRKLHEGLDQADRLIESFLILARAQRGIQEDLETVQLDAIVAAAATGGEGRSAELRVRLRCQAARVSVFGNATLLRRLVDNLLDNALRYNQPGGFVDIRCEKSGGDGNHTTAILIVENSGPALDDEQVARLGQPFQRVSAERVATGSVGLGLSIVYAIASAHDGTLRLKPRAQGGLRAVVEMPATGCHSSAVTR
jgi:signal transduction histidine kinase